MEKKMLEILEDNRTPCSPLYAAIGTGGFILPMSSQFFFIFNGITLVIVWLRADSVRTLSDVIVWLVTFIFSFEDIEQNLHGVILWGCRFFLSHFRTLEGEPGVL